MATDPQARFWKNVLKTDDGCWTWTGHTNKGYGIFYCEGRQWRAHRLLWKWEYFKIPDDLCIDHLCRNKRCVRPEHLEICTWSMNGYRAYQDSVAARGGQRPPQMSVVHGKPQPTALRVFPDEASGRKCFEVRKREVDGHWLVRSDQQRGIPSTVVAGKAYNTQHMLFTWEIRPLREDEILHRICGEPRCVRPQHQHPITKVELGLANMAKAHAYWEPHWALSRAERHTKQAAKVAEEARLAAKACALNQMAAQMRLAKERSRLIGQVGTGISPVVQQRVA